MNYKVERFEPKETPDEFWDKYFEFIHFNHKENNPGEPFPDREALIQRQKADFPDYYMRRWLAFDEDGKVVGWAGFGNPEKSSTDYEENKHIANINLMVRADYRRKGIGTELLKATLKEAQKRNCTIAEIGSDHDHGKAFLRALGGQIAIEGAENRLQMKDVNWDLMQTWIDEGPKRAQGVQIESFDFCPEEILEEYCEMYTEALNMQPLGELESRANVDGKTMRAQEKRLKETGQKHYALISRETDGRISGLTQIFYDERDGHRILQGLTGVRPEFRGRGLGKWLKALMVFYIKENYPKAEYILTGNAESNESMLSINRRMGFKKHKGAESYKFGIEDLVKKLQI